MMRCAPALVLLCAAVSLSAGQSSRTFTGLITDDMCPLGDHSRMQMGPTDAECAKACAIAHASPYVLYDGKTVYRLSDQKSPEEFAARKVRVIGTLEEKTMTIRVESMTSAR
jgi:hypothetical protein